MQRLTKYPLLLESIIKHTEGRVGRGASVGGTTLISDLVLALTYLVTLESHLTSLVFRVFILALL